MSAEKALRLVMRYARVQTTICQRKLLYSRLFDLCEKPIHNGDEFAGSGCMVALKETISENNKGDYRDRIGFDEMPDACEFCRPCRLGLRVLSHNRRTLSKRRGAVLAAIRRLGTRHITSNQEPSND